MAQSQIKNFQTAVSEQERQEQELDAVDFQVNGKGPITREEHDRTKTMYSIIVPDEAQVGLYTAAFGGKSPSIPDVMKAMMDLFETNMEPGHFRDLRNRVLDPDDPVDIDTLQQILEWVLEEAAGFPTQPSSDSSSSGSPDSQKSTASSRSAGSTPSASRRAVSPTSSTRARSRR